MSLSQDIAKLRTTIITKDSISYNFNIILQTQQYTGLAELAFSIFNTNFVELYIDFSPTTVSSIKVNSIQIPIPQNIVNFLIIPRKYLQKGRNFISVLYTNNYNADGLGCNTFRDQQNLQYVYTKFQPYGANRVFPCFDQPDLKATMTLSVVTPSEWNQPISNQPVNSTSLLGSAKYHQNCCLTSSSKSQLKIFQQNIGADTFLTRFQTTQRLPTYVFAFAAGHLALIQNVDGPVPMSIYALTSNMLNIQRVSSYVLDVTQKAMIFFTDLFGKSYPFKKYDQIFLRGLSYWAMENAGMVTINESLIQTQPTQLDYYNLADTVVHELSHHWFGNYVTMQWWDDLWLNESFASFIASYALQKISSSLQQPLKTPPAIYFRDTKYSGYVQDERNTSTHPIRGKVGDTVVAKSIFDAITYNKGAAVLNQLMFLVSQKNFALALKSYFGRFSWSNATVLDLLQDMAPYFPKQINVSIDQWRVDWLQSASLNIFESIWDPSKTTSAETLTLYQSPYRSTDTNLRCHSLEIAFFDSNGAKTQSQLVLVDKATNKTDVTYDGSKNVAAVLVNYNDYAYIQSYIDHNSLQFFMANINKIVDDTARWLIWYNISSMVRQALVSVSQFATMIQVQLFSEPIDLLVDRMLDFLLSNLSNFVGIDEATQIKSAIFDKIYLELKTGVFTENDTDRIQIYYKHYIGFAVTDAHKMKLNDLLQDADLTNVTTLIEVDDQLCWKIVKKVFSVGSPEFKLLDSQKWAIFDYMSSYDVTYRQSDARIVCQVILANPLNYYDLYNSLLVPGLDLTVRKLIAQGLSNSYHQQLFNKIYRARYFNDIVDPNVYNKLSYLQYETFYKYLKPKDQNYADLISSYQIVLQSLNKQVALAAHSNNIRKIIDDLTINLQNNPFNADTNLALTKIRADQRTSYIEKNSVSYISNITYIPLNGPSSTYSGLTEITFTLNSLPKFLPIDFVAYQITDLIVNGVNVVSAQNGQFLVIPKVYLKLGVNNIAVNYVNLYNNDGLGCMGYTDTTSGTSYYTYTSFQPYSAHKFIPCFDQPNLKAPASFNVIVPTGWMSASNNASIKNGTYSRAAYTLDAPEHYYPSLLSKYLAGKSGDYYIFEKTKTLSPYLYCVISGQYYSVVATPQQQYKNIPMTLYSLQSYQSNLDQLSTFIFETTYRSLQLYESKFVVPYAFQKYDSVFCHEYKFGAMQNPGLITFNDSYLYGQSVSVQKMAYLAIVIAHECAHNWFGNYVTMSWWDDLWLNQSFADFISYYCLENIRTIVPQLQELTSGYLSAVQRAIDGYREDQLSTTHPIRANIPNTSLALSNFDSITYSKGSMTMKQLMFLMTEANFFKGLTNYFVKYALDNATIDDFLIEMKAFFDESNFTLAEWKDMWILTPSLNVITPKWDPLSVSSRAILSLNQTNFSPAHKMLRYHKVNVAFFKADGSYTTQQVLIQNTAQTLVFYDASAGISGILVNSDHQDFVKYRFDKTSQEFFTNNLSLIQDPVARMVTYFYLNEQVRDGVQGQKVLDYRDSVLIQLETQTQDTIFQFELNFMKQATSLYIPSIIRQTARTPLFDFVLTSLESFGNNQQKNKLTRKQIIHNRKQTLKERKALNYSSIKKPENSFKTLSSTLNRIKILKDLLPVFCSNVLSQIDVIKSWFQGTYAPLNNYTITVSQGWEVVKLIYANKDFTANQKQAAYDRQKAKDQGITADLIKYTCTSLSSLDPQMLTIYTDVFKAENESITVKSYTADGWNHPIHQDILLNTFKTKIFEDIPLLSKQLSAEHFAFFYTRLQPIDDDLQTTIKLYKGIKLEGTGMLGDINNIKMIIENLELRQKLYVINTP